MNDLKSYKSEELDSENSTKYLDRLKCVCRLCLSQPQEIQLFANTPQSLNNLKYSEIVMDLANVKINENDNLPKGICEECSSKLILFFKFKQKIELSQSTLDAFLETTIETSCIDIDVPMYEENGNVYNPVEAIDEDSLHLVDNNQEELDQQELEDKQIDELESQIDYIEDTGDGGGDNDGGGENGSIEDEEAEYEIEEVMHHSIYKEQQDNEKIEQLIDETEEYHIEVIYEDIDHIGSNCGVSYKIIESDTQIKTENIEDTVDEIVPSNIVYKSKPNNRNSTTLKRDPKPGVLFNCDICGQGFSRKSTLVQHSSVHSEEKKFKCEICEKKFTRRGHVTVHMRAHNNIRPYACDTCGRAFTKSGDLSRHKKIHSDVHDYYCSFCGKGFKRAEYLQSHLNMHNGVKPYRCKTCEKEYSSYSSMTKHCKKFHH